MAYQLGPISITGSAVNVSGSISVDNNDLRPYKVYTALLTQTGTNDPSASVLENTLGEELAWTRDFTGSYFVTASSNIFTEKTAVFTPNFVMYLSVAGDDPNYVNAWYYGLPTNTIYVSSGNGPDAADGQLSNHPIEIRVYN